MTNTILADFYERDLHKLIDELNLFTDETDLWKTCGSIKNSAGNLALHIIGGLNYLIGTQLAQTGYLRQRDQEFIQKDVAKKELITQLEELIPMIGQTIKRFGGQGMEADYPIPFDDAVRPVGYVLTQLLLHLNYHLGQVNYCGEVWNKKKR